LRRQEEDKLQHRHRIQRTKKRVVVPLADTPKKRDDRPSPEQVNSTGGDVPEPLLFHLMCRCACRRRNGDYCCYGRCGVTEREMTEGGVQNIYYAEDTGQKA
jgi:hypothetical protein